MPARKRREGAFCPHTFSKCPFFERIIQMGEDIARMKGDIRWMKWLLVIILAALLGTAAFM